MLSKYLGFSMISKRVSGKLAALLGAFVVLWSLLVPGATLDRGSGVVAAEALCLVLVKEGVDIV